jgi:co-chaperonin GroES (HSP10)
LADRSTEEEHTWRRRRPRRRLRRRRRSRSPRRKRPRRRRPTRPSCGRWADTAKEKPQEGIVVALGEGRKTTSGKLLPFEVGIGDRVMIEKYSGSEVTIDDEEYTIIKEDGVLAILA